MFEKLNINTKCHLLHLNDEKYLFQSRLVYYTTGIPNALMNLPAYLPAKKAEKEKNIDRMIWDEQNSSLSDVAHNDKIDTEIVVADSDNDSCGSETQSLISKDSCDKNSLTCEAGTNSPLYI